jgi:O-antigen ligase
LSSSVEVEQLRRRVAAAEAGILAAACSFAMVMDTVFIDAVSTSRLVVVFGALLLIQVLVLPRLFFCREFALYVAFVAYLFLTLLWTPDPVLGMNTLFPAVNFVLILIIMGSLVTFSDARAVLLGTLIGLWAGAAVLTYSIGFPFVLPGDMSYNGVAAIYLYGLYVALMLACLTRAKVLLLTAALLAMAHIVATTSIKTNLGILIGAAAAALVYFRESLRLLRRHVLMLVIGVGVIAYGVASSNLALEGLARGVDRVALGVNVLQTRRDTAGYQGFDERTYWARQGLNAWASNPVFGAGVEAFRANYGITSHSAPIDLLYNTGLIGLLLFYGMYASLAWRLLKSGASQSVRALTLAVVVCNVFMSFSGTLFYQTFLAASIAIGAAMLERDSSPTKGFE